MTEKRFTLEMQYWKGNPQGRKLFDNLTGQDGMSVEELCNIASALHCKCEELKIVLEVYEDSLNKLEKENKELKQHIKKLEKEVHFEHMRSMFSTVKSFKGDVSKRYYYSEETDTLYDSANNYGQYDKILDKKEIVMLLNEYETLLNERDRE